MLHKNTEQITTKLVEIIQPEIFMRKNNEGLLFAKGSISCPKILCTKMIKKKKIVDLILIAR